MMLQKIKVTQQRKLHKYCILDDGMVLDPIISNSIKSAPAYPINLFSTAEYTLVASACWHTHNGKLYIRKLLFINCEDIVTFTDVWTNIHFPPDDGTERVLLKFKFHSNQQYFLKILKVRKLEGLIL